LKLDRRKFLGSAARRLLAYPSKVKRKSKVVVNDSFQMGHLLARPRRVPSAKHVEKFLL